MVQTNFSPIDKKFKWRVLQYHRQSQKSVITEEIWEFLRVPFPCLPTFIALPKTHKNIINPLRSPIISGIRSITSNASTLIYLHLQPHVSDLPSHIKDTIHLLRIIEHMVVPTNSYLVTIDVESLYNSILHKKGITTVGNFLRERGQEFWSFNSFVLKLLDFILKHNVFNFAGHD